LIARDVQPLLKERCYECHGPTKENNGYPAYRKGVQFLLTTQLADGSWFVRTRAHPVQVYFESGFPHGHDQFISAAATNWATLALMRAHAPTSHPSRSRGAAEEP
jgi:hypothetical protein